MAPTLSEDDTDDLIYFARAGELGDFREALEALCKREGCAVDEVLAVAVDGESGNGVLHMAAANGHSEIIKHLLTALPSSSTLPTLLNTRNAAGNTPLHWAALNGHLSAVQVLVEAGADPYIQNGVGHDAIYEAEVNDRKEAVDWMLKEGGEGLEELGEAAGGEGEGEDSAEGVEGGAEGMEGLKEAVEGLSVGKGKGKEEA
ncbi:hypothetical protein V496_05991 [Pseudogymnoascus sp. VKM F-4515 (FW-2607)]|nr:hypothetical protein V496_05991 [Pseudogymnoascus sp. VKM F-4515 (FW-2607)]KFY86377.1 hypothetical protein V498_07527 [Pseudogymnoascus sp. VKM F-4517 (FW-2822)]